MTRWGLFLASIGCILIIYSQTMTSSLMACFAGVLVVITGFMLVYRDKKNEKASKKTAKKR